MKELLLSNENNNNKKLILEVAIFFAMLIFNNIPLPAQTNNGTGAYSTHHYRNLFVENGHSNDSVSLKINNAFQQLFHGDSLHTLYFEAGKNANGPLAYLADVLHKDVRSEGMSYGMMIAVQLNKKAEFDALWNWATTYMYIRDTNHPNYGYFSWSMKYNGEPYDDTAAPDGEEYFTMSLYFAAARWGNGEGIYNYKAWADKILTAIRHHKTKTGNTLRGGRTIRTMVNEDYKMIRFVANDGANNFSDPSYHLPAFYELWSRFGPETDRTFWAAAADSSRAFFQKATNPETGLAPDYANFNGSPMIIQWNLQAQNFSFDSWRTAMNWSVDWAWWGKDKREQELSNRIQTFFAKSGIDNYGCQYTLNGTVINPQHHIGLISTNAVTSLAAKDPIAKQFVEALWNAPIPSELGERYYDGTLYMMGLLHCSGMFRIWE
jgi:oligosaccharide reducing-end xylanase